MYILLFVLLVGFAGFSFYMKWPEISGSASVSRQSSSTPEQKVVEYEDVVLPRDVVVTDLGNGEKLVRNEREGYELAIANKLIVNSAEDGSLTVQNSLMPKNVGGIPDCEYNVERTDRKINNYVAEAKVRCENEGPNCTGTSVVKKKIGNYDWTEIRINGGFIGSGWPSYILETGDGAINIYFKCSDNTFISENLTKFTLK